MCSSDLFLGRESADARYQLIRERYLNHIEQLDGDSNSLFWQELNHPNICDGLIYTTGFLDAMDAAGFWQGGN